MENYQLTADHWQQLGDDGTDLVARPPAAVIDHLLVAGTGLAADALIDAHLPLAELIMTMSDQVDERRDAMRGYLGLPSRWPTLIVGVTGGVASGKSLTARVLESILAATDDTKVEVVSTDGFLFSNRELAERGLLERKGFPETYDYAKLITFLTAIKTGSKLVPAPIYDHVTYDVLTRRVQIVDRPRILILEGVNLLQPAPPGDASGLLVSDFLDYSIYVDADESDLRTWFLRRTQDLRSRSAAEPTSFFAQFASVTDADFLAVGTAVWDTVNRPNLEAHIAPSRARADLIVEKAADHSIRRVLVRNH